MSGTFSWKPGGSFRYGSFELTEVSRTGERLARVIDATEGKTEEKGRSECEKDYRRYRRKKRRKQELRNKEESGTKCREGRHVDKEGRGELKEEKGRIERRQDSARTLE